MSGVSNSRSPIVPVSESHSCTDNSPPGPNMPPTGPDLQALLLSERYSDLKLVCNSREFKVHKAVICTRSAVLATACEKLTCEFKESVIHIQDFEPETVRRMVKFMYTKDYGGELSSVNASTKPDGQSEAEFEPSEAFRALIEENPGLWRTPSNAVSADGSDISAAALQTTDILLGHVQVNGIAGRYDVEPLRRVANEKIKEVLQQGWHAKGFPLVIAAALKTTDDGSLREILSTAAAQHIEDLVQQETFTALTDSFTLALINSMIRQSKFTHDYLLGLLDDFMTNQSQILGSNVAKAERLDAVESALNQESAKHKETAAALLREQSKVQDSELALTQARIRGMNADRLQRDLGELQKCRNVLNSTTWCRHCYEEFPCKIEESQTIPGASYVLRCSQCRTRHW